MQAMTPPAVISSAAGSSYDAGNMPSSDLAPALERFVHRHLVGIVEVAADRHAHGDARHLDPERLEQSRQVDGGRLAVNIRIGREDDFAGAGADALQQALDLEIVWSDSLQRRERAHQDVVDALELAGLLDRGDVLRLLDDADYVVVAIVAAAEGTRIRVGDVVADRAVGDTLFHLANRVDQPIGLLARRLQDEEREALSALRTDAGQPLQLFDEAEKRIGKRQSR